MARLRKKGSIIIIPCAGFQVFTEKQLNTALAEGRPTAGVGSLAGGSPIDGDGEPWAGVVSLTQGQMSPRQSPRGGVRESKREGKRERERSREIERK